MIVSLLLLTFAAYSNIPRLDFMDIDDGSYVTNNSHVRDGLTLDGIWWAFTSAHAGNWHPLTWISHMIDTQLFGLKPRPHHLVNLLIHAINALLLFFLLKKMTGDFWPGALAAALFAIHPIGVESVAWIAERKNVLSTMFGLLAVRSYVQYAREPSKFRYAVVMLWMALGLMSKPMLVTLPLVFLLLDFWPLNRARKNLFIEKIPLFGLSIASAAATLAAQSAGDAVATLETFPIGLRLANVPVSYASYLSDLLCPGSLAFFYPLSVETVGAGKLSAALAILALITATVWKTAPRKPYLAVGWLWFLVTLIPVIGLVQVGRQSMADRYMYIPQIGLYLMAAWTAADLAQKKSALKYVLTALSIIGLAALMPVTRAQTLHWQNPQTLYTHALQVTKGNHLAHYNLANFLLVQKRFEEAETHYRRAAGIRAEFYPGIHTLIAYTMFSRGKYSESISYLTEILQKNPHDVEALVMIGNAYTSSGDDSKALENFLRAVKFKPDCVPAHLNAGYIFRRAGDLDRAIFHFTRILEIDPKNIPACSELSVALLHAGKYADAEVILRHLISIEPDSPMHRNNRGLALASLGKLDDAIAEYREAVRREPAYDVAYYNMGNTFARQEKWREAAAEYETALKYNPRHERAKINLDTVRKFLSGTVTAPSQ